MKATGSYVSCFVKGKLNLFFRERTNCVWPQFPSPNVFCALLVLICLTVSTDELFAQKVILIPLTNAVWRFNQSNNLNRTVIGVDWTGPAYDDTQPLWQSGPSLIAGGENNPLIVPLIRTTVNPPT